MPIIKDFAKKAVGKILGKIVPRNYEVGEPTGPGAEETLKRQMPPRGQKKPTKPTPKGEEIKPEEPPKAPEQPSIEEPIKKPSGQAPSVKHEEPARGEKGTPAGESGVPGKPTGGGGKALESAQAEKGSSGGQLEWKSPKQPTLVIEKVEKLKGEEEGPWREKGRPETKEYIIKLIGTIKDIGGTAVLISGIALASLVGLGTLTEEFTGKKLEDIQPVPGVIGVQQGAGKIQPSQDIQKSTLSGGSRTCVSAPRGSGVLTNKDPDCSDGRGGDGFCKKTYLNNPRTGKLDLYKGECTNIKRTDPVSGTDTCVPCVK